MKLYNRLSRYLKEKYGERVQRLPINGGFTCPNKTGEKGRGGCIYCDSSGSGFASLVPEKSIEEQIKAMIKRYDGRANKYMAYFQSNTNTYASIKVLKKKYDQAFIDDRIIILDISTRPDCVDEEKLDLIASYKQKVDVMIEYGVESSNEKTLKLMNRGHNLNDVYKATNMAKERKIEVIHHYIMDFPKDSVEDIKNMAKICNELKIDGVKLHSLYITENTKLAEMYKNGDITPLTIEEYVNRVIIFLEELNPEIVIHRLVSEPPIVGTIHGNWGLSKSKVLSIIENEMKKRDSYQGKNFK
ncbi:TIGR01212 family radical SAM protein [Oceanotoga sp. DSM 15011]|uniref:Radical SAM core domain-containing protein n=1 Tax=Oceanotoga teriensis TaxID=515440 RepID=A0AA45C897_9BACT|nr:MULTISPECIES: TIGR01212 family radical SAM protein [Oceanotoga]MDO7975612.1 TIGR01212 family radical SAM protein [Oceanotoga teriensis]PWJ96099.1 hypothetical protein C7380_1025 [Oceanotoga teriensis]UYO99881.1 TIGR01212 family radical SAM protein [Oceanotoga sp. DSM 15011]